MALGLSSITGRRVELGPLERLLAETADIAHAPAVTDALARRLESLLAAGEAGVDVGVVRDPNEGLALALLLAAGAIEPIGLNLRLAPATLQRLRAS